MKRRMSRRAVRVALLSLAVMLFNRCDEVALWSLNLSITPGVLTIAKGSSDSVRTSVTAQGGKVVLSAKNVPQLVTVTFAPDTFSLGMPGTILNGSGWAIVHVDSHAVAATYGIEIHAEEPDQNYYDYANLVVNVVDSMFPGFTLSLSTSSLSIQRGGNDSIDVIIGRSPGSTETIALTEEIDHSLTTTFSPPQTTAGRAMMRISVPAGAAFGMHTLRVKARGLSTNLERFVDLVVNVSQGSFSLTVSPSYLVMYTGQPATATVSINRAGCADPILLTLQGNGGNFYEFNPNPIPASQPGGSLRVDPLGPGIAQIVYRLTGSGCGLNNSLGIISVMQLPAETQGNFMILPANATLDLTPGGNSATEVRILRFGSFTAAVSFTSENTPPGDTVLFSPQNTTSDIIMMSYHSAPTSVGGTFMVKGTAGSSVSRWSELVYTRQQYENYLSFTGPNTVTVQRGHAGSAAVTLSRHGLTGPVDLWATDYYEGISATFSDPAPTGNSSTLQVSVEQTVPPGNYWLQISGAAGGNLQSYRTVILVVLP